MITYRNPFPNNNDAITEDYLEELIRILSHERGHLAIEEDLKGYQDLEVTHSKVVHLEVPEEAVSALLMVEGDLTSQLLHRVIRYKENGSDPTAASGFGLGTNDVYHIAGKSNLNQFRIIGIEDDKKHWLRIQYYKTTAQ